MKVIKIMDEKNCRLQKLLIIQQNNKAESKIKGVKEYGQNRFKLEVISIHSDLPDFIDDSSEYLPGKITADLVLDFMQHPDLSEDLANICEKIQVPLISSGKKIRNKWVLTPPT